MTGSVKSTASDPESTVSGDSFKFNIVNDKRLSMLLVAGSSLAAVLAAALSHKYGYEGVSRHVFYFPVILACFFYGVRGFFISVLLIVLNTLHMLFYHNDPVPELVIHMLIFFPAAALVSYISYKWKRSVEKAASEIAGTLLKSEQYRLLLDELSDPVFAVTTGGDLLYLNKAFAVITGKDLEFFRGKNIWNMLPEENPVERANVMNEVIESGREKQIEMRVPFKGKVRYFLTTLTPVRGENEKADFLICFGKDITERRNVENALNMTLDNLRRSQEMGRLADWRMDLETGIYTGSSVGYDILGVDHNEVLTREKIRLLYEPSDAISAGEAMRAALAINGSYSIVSRIYRKNDGELRYILSTAQVETGSSNQPVALFGINQDITERIRTEEALRESEELNRIITGLTTDYAYIVDVSPDKKITVRWVSDNMPDLTGRSKDDVKSFESWKEIFPPEDYEKFTAFMWRVLGSCESGSLECRSIRANGDIRWINIYAFPKKMNNGAITVYGAIKDITVRKKAEEDLFRFKFMVENARQEVYLVKADGNLEYVNRAAADSLGYTVDEMLSIGVRGFDPDFGPRFRAHFEELKAHDLPFFETVHIAKDGRRINKEMHSVYISFNNNEYICGFGQDITERKMAEEEKRRLQEQLAQSQKMESVGRLAGGVAHDFNNMLGVIIGQAELALMKCEQSGRVHDSLREIEKAARRSADLTSQLLAFARKQAVAPRVIDLNMTISGMITMLRRLIGEDIELEWLPGMPLWNVRIDPAQVDQVLANLCVNARDAISGTGSIRIETGNVVLDESWCTDHNGSYPGEYVVLTVSDTGAGFTAEALAHVFEPFFTTKELGKGTGLGLAMVYGIVKQNGGFIDVKSRDGEGAAFLIYLPRSDDENAGPGDDPDQKTPETGTETILLVEDEPMLLDMTGSMLQDLGYKVIAVSTPAEALKAAKEQGENIKLLITDVIMPELNGRDLSSRILEIIPGLDRLFMSGYTSDVIAHHGVLEEGVHFIQKPFNLKDLSVQVRNAIGRRDVTG